MHGYPMSEIYYLLHDPDKVLLIFFFARHKFKFPLPHYFSREGTLVLGGNIRGRFAFVCAEELPRSASLGYYVLQHAAPDDSAYIKPTIQNAHGISNYP